MGFQSGRRQRTARVAFTLVELLLVVVLLGLLFSAVVFSLDSLQRGAQLEEGAGQVETLLRFARARASATGRQVRISFEGSDLTGALGRVDGSSDGSSATNAPGAVSESRIAVEWEPDPIGAPGRFETLREASSYLEQIGALVQIEGRSPEKELVATMVPADSVERGSTRPGLSPASNSLSMETNSVSGPRPPLFFYPDGSSDSAELVVRSRDESERRSVVLSLSGLTGAIRQRWVSPDSGTNSSEPDSASASLSTAAGSGSSGGAR